MKRNTRQACAVAALALAIAYLAAAPASRADFPCGTNPDQCICQPETLYRIINLGTPVDPFTCDLETSDIHVKAWGINSLGEIVGEVRCVLGDADTTNWQAFVILARTNSSYPIAAGQMRILPGTCSNANDINDNGVVVGWAGTGVCTGVGVDNTDAAVWWLVQFTAPQLLNVLSVDHDTTQAWAVNNRTPFQVVGDHVLSQETRGFLWQDRATSITVLNPNSSWEESRGLAINDDVVAALIGGIAGSCTEPAPPTTSCNFNCNEAVADGVWWTAIDFSAEPLATVAGSSFRDPQNNELAGEARGVNNVGNLVGRVDECLGPPTNTRRQRASFWRSTVAVPTNLGATQFVGGVNQETYANAVTNGTAPTVVGRNDSSDLAILWQDLDGSGTAEDWCHLDLNDAIHPTLANKWDLKDATDVNDGGWIVGWGDYQGVFGTRAFLMVPLGACPADINGDGVVNVSDYVLVNTNWGQTTCLGEALFCPADVTGDGLVNVQDLTAVIVNWGPCGGSALGGGGVGGGEAAPEGAATPGGDWTMFLQDLLAAGLTVQDFIDLMTFDYLEDENYRCWLSHYLMGTIDAAAQECPGPDAFSE